MSTVPEILKLLRESRFDDALPLANDALRNAHAESSKKLNETARDLVRWQGIFKNTNEAKASEDYFRTVHSLLAELSGEESSITLAAADNLAGLLGSIGKTDEAIALREQVLAHLSMSRPTDDQRLNIVRDSLSILYQRAGRQEKLAELYRDTKLCEHLRTLEQYVRDQGGRVISVGQPWSANCRTWVYFDVLLDCDRLIKSLGLAPCVQIHDHRGTHDGSERGIVCTIHHDAVMGPHPVDASPTAKTIT
jgi:hypothetical protein